MLRDAQAFLFDISQCPADTRTIVRPIRAEVAMVLFIAGLLLFLGVHSTRVFAEGWRSATIARIGERPWKGIYSLVSIAAFVLLVWGYGQVRQQMPLWDPPAAMRFVTVLLMLPVFVVFVAAYVPRNRIKAMTGGDGRTEPEVSEDLPDHCRPLEKKTVEHRPAVLE